MSRTRPEESPERRTHPSRDRAAPVHSGACGVVPVRPLTSQPRVQVEVYQLSFTQYL